jgi:hypothetical protein
MACKVFVVLLLGRRLVASRKDNQNRNSGLRDGASISGRLLPDFLALCGVGIELVSEESDRGNAKSVIARGLDDLADVVWRFDVAADVDLDRVNPEASAKSSTSSIGRSLKVDV